MAPTYAVPLTWYLILSAILFCLGIAGFFTAATSSPSSCRSS